MRNRLHLLLLFSVFVVATCGLIYELVAGTLASYLLGDSVTQFSTIIGVYLFSMGIGSFLSRYFNRNLLGWFIQIEILVGVVGGISAAALFLLFEQVESFRVLLYAFVVMTGMLVGLEIPLLMRILKNRIEFKELVSQVFTFDYIGALLASLVFPLVLVPYLGLVKTSFLFGILNVLVALILCFRFSDEMPWARYLKSSGIIALLFLLGGFIASEKIMSLAESQAYHEQVIFAESSHYQRIVLTRNNDELRLYLNGNLQFSSLDEYRYHEALVHPVMNAVRNPKRVLVLGGGDGLAIREILKYPVDAVTLVDLDPAMTSLFRENAMLAALNDSSFYSPKVQLVNDDAYQWLKNHPQTFDCIIVDFPDPSNYSIGKLYTTAFYNQLYHHLQPEGAVVIQSTSPYVAPRSFWCVDKTLKTAGFITLPYHAYVPSFGEWGYVMAAKAELTVASGFPPSLRFLDATTFEQMKKFPKDMQRRETDVNRLNNQILVHYFEEEWANFQ